jgi:hypothetical protein
MVNAGRRRRQGRTHAAERNQAYFLLSLSHRRIVVALKSRLMWLSAKRKASDMRALVPADVPPAPRRDSCGGGGFGQLSGVFHINDAKLNKTSASRLGSALLHPMPKQALLIVMQMMAAQDMQSAPNHRDGYQRSSNPCWRCPALPC